MSCLTAISLASAAPFSFKDVKADISKLLTTNNPLWPFDDPDTTSYGPFMVRHAWHCAGSYRTSDGNGGCDGGRQRFEPERSWDDNTNLDKAKLLLYPIKQKYGDALSWGDLIILTGTTAIEDMGGPKTGFCGGRIDDVDGTDSLELGPTATQQQYAPCKQQGNCSVPLGTTTIGLIYVDPGGPLGVPDPTGSAPQIRDAFGRMAMNDNETVALIGGGHAFGKTHGACPDGAGEPPSVNPENPWAGNCGNGKGNWTYTSGFEGPWTTTPCLWGNQYFTNLVNFEYEKFEGAGNKTQWRIVNATKDRQKLSMLTTDIALTKDPIYLALVNKYAADLPALTKDFGDAWYKLVTRDMGPISRCTGDLIPPPQEFQYPLPDPPATFPSWDDVRAAIRTAMTTKSDALTPDTLGQTPYYGAAFTTLAWQCSSTFRRSDYLGGCNGARIRYPPQATWPENLEMNKVLEILESVYTQFKAKNLSHADLIILASQVALEDAANLTLPGFCPGRVDAADGKGSEYLNEYNYHGPGMNLTVSEIFIHKSTVRGLSLREAVALQARPRSKVIQVARGFSGTWGNSSVISNTYFSILLDPDTTWTCKKDECQSSKDKNVYMTTEDLALRWEPSLRTIAEQYASNNTLFLRDFAWSWNKLVTNDRFKGPNDNLCHSRVPPGPSPSPSPSPAAVPYGGIIGAGAGGIVLGALVVFVMMRRSNKSDEMYNRV